MIDHATVEEAIAELENSKPTYEACRNLAALYVIQDRMNKCSGIGGVEISSEFVSVVKGKPIPAVLSVMDELMHTVRMLSPKTYRATIDSLTMIEAG